MKDRRGQLDYIAGHNVRAAITLGDTIDAGVGRLALFPYLGRTGRVPSTRELVLGGTPYVVDYRIEQDDIEILRLLHGAQRWPVSF